VCVIRINMLEAVLYIYAESGLINTTMQNLMHTHINTLYIQFHFSQQQSGKTWFCVCISMQPRIGHLLLFYIYTKCCLLISSLQIRIHLRRRRQYEKYSTSLINIAAPDFKYLTQKLVLLFTCETLPILNFKQSHGNRCKQTAF